MSLFQINSRILVIIRVALVFIIYYFTYPYWKQYVTPSSPAIFHSIDQLTGAPFLIDRISHLFFALIIYLSATLILERENWKKALFIRDSLIGVLKGALLVLPILTATSIILFLTGLIEKPIFNLDFQDSIAIIGAFALGQVFNAPEEEIIFRGYLLRKLADKFNKHVAIAITSVLFGLAHLSRNIPFPILIEIFLFATTAGFIFGYAYLFYKNIYVPIGMHMAFDVYSHTVLNGRVINLHNNIITSWQGAQLYEANLIYILVSFTFLVLYILGLEKRK